MNNQPNIIKFRRPYSNNVELSFTGVLKIRNENLTEVIKEPIARNYVYDFIQKCKKEGMETSGVYYSNGDIDMKITGERRSFYVSYKVGPQQPRNDFNLNLETVKKEITRKI